MTSKERREARYERRVALRSQRKLKRLHLCDDFDQVFSYSNLYAAQQKCRKGVAWKASVQSYIAQAPLNVYRTWKQLQDGRYRTPGFYEFDLYERGKHRHIRSTVIGERVVQRCLCDNAIVPALCRTFVYDNGASMKGKGYDFAVRRITCHLQRHFRKHGQDGYILLFDFSKFFDNISHKIVKLAIRKELTDPKIIRICDMFIDAFGDVGLGLGSQISQVLALVSANRLDHFVKEWLGIKLYGRYMDDGYLIHPSKKRLAKCLRLINAVCKRLGIKMNAKKTQIVKLSHGFTWLKIRFFISETGKIIRKICKQSIVRMRRRLKKFRLLVDRGVMGYNDVYTAWQSWYGYSRRFRAYYTRKRMAALYTKLFVYDWRNEPCFG